jgi:hypothetical protein
MYQLKDVPNIVHDLSDLIIRFGYVHCFAVVGGALQERESKDTDILIACELFIIENIASVIKHKYSHEYEVVIHEGYDAWIRDRYALIIKMKCKRTDAEFDFLFLEIAKDKRFNVVSYMTGHFPLDIQRMALTIIRHNIFDYNHYDLSMLKEENVINVAPGYTKHAPVVKKYMKYFPNATFEFQPHEFNLSL